MNYQETLDYLYSRLPVFQNVGARAFKPGLHTTRELCKFLGDPQNDYPTLHIAGTNGKGSTSHMLAAILQQAGYKVGLYTSPHLKDFRERIRVNGAFIGENFITEFISENKSNIERLSPSFFEATVAMAFSYFSKELVDIAVIEVGMGGRLDSTNIITPALSLITNISLDHTQFLGETLEEIAAEKAGIIKPGVPVVISERQTDSIAEVFSTAAERVNAPVVFASNVYEVNKTGFQNGLMEIDVIEKESLKPVYAGLRLDLTGAYQLKNIGGVIAAIEILREKGWALQDADVRAALASVTTLTGLKGRWQKLGEKPDIYCDTGHNTAGLASALEQFESVASGCQRFVVGFVGDKDISAMLQLFPSQGIFYFCQPSNMRALDSTQLMHLAAAYGLKGKAFVNVNDALEAAKRESDPNDTIYVGGSTFVVADIIDW
ncbi:bifunctional folylpolyglutamate synthase/dihydrofolate synthase [Dyadobacter fanqingshengii]|uniref:Dihydrofolate synthase/folylpolyglutamate synthase n=1 Tax=Dyadobacter fanqingshengii TaxID=2906443 RepID=A0A9X1PB37_9BACT|nr:folylpolyglutamate synthase/dihydrofolate synthase family protein [Dyadobacter fanqingshengii]MCF0040979.1 bifunctional folylpolyglutamate synthase/dihydrofolate synthase [Dyadobacter fanqingshengii]USJ37290.1 bifunctional folylpolyglutamate synthase/dihydrofolate synthase [Dyadobacter fanqingshengii]